MASSCSLLSEQLCCSICLDVVTHPVTIPCGHNFCMACIKGYWESTSLCQCPLCKKLFNQRPDLIINTFVAEIVNIVGKSSPAEKEPGILEQPSLAQPGDIGCDVCTDAKLKALKSCLECLASYCENHLEPHHRVASFKKHTLVDPVENLEDKVCKIHKKPLELFCMNDEMCVCQFCAQTDHKAHFIVLVEEEYKERKTQFGKTNDAAERMINERLEKVKEIELSLKRAQSDSEWEVEDSVRFFTDLVRSIKKIQANHIREMEEQQRRIEKQGRDLIKELQLEIILLKKSSTELKQVLCKEDWLNFLQTSESIWRLPVTKDWSQSRVHSSLGVGMRRRAIYKLEKTVSEQWEELSEAELSMVQAYAVDVTLDARTASPKLELSEDGKQVRLGQRPKLFIDSSLRFDPVVCVLGEEGFTSGRFYYEVEVKGKTRWALGVARESIARKGNITLSPVNGYWTVGLLDGDEYVAHAGPCVPLPLDQRPQRVGVFVDYEAREVSFYDVDARSPIYSYTRIGFTERLYPILYLGHNTDATNRSPMTICPMIQV